MSGIDKFVDELRRSGDTTLILLSESEPRVRGKSGERTLAEKTSHKAVTALVEEIVPPECFADLVMMEPVEFPISHPAGELAIRVVPGPSIWRVVVDVREGGLAPLPGGEPEREPSGSGAVANRQSARSDPASKSGTRRGGSWAEIEQLVDPVDSPPEAAEPEPEAPPPKKSHTVTRNPLDQAMEAAAQAPTGTDDDVPLSEALFADDGAALDEDDEDIDLASFMPSDGDEPADDDGAPGRDEGEEAPSPVSLHSAPTPPAPLDQEQRSTVQIGGRPPPTLEPRADASQGPEEDGGAPPVEPRGAARPVEPIEIDLSESELEQHRIDGLDPLLDAAWSQGATGLLLRDDCVPMMVKGDRIAELPFGSADQGAVVRDLVDIVASPSEAEQLELGGQCRFLYRTGSAVRVRCTVVQDGGALSVSIRRIGEEHLPDRARVWLPDVVPALLPDCGLILVCSRPGHGRTTVAAALAALAQEQHRQAVVVGEPLERRLPGDGACLLQRRIPDDVPNCSRALEDAHLLEASLVLVDVPRPDRELGALLSLAAQGRLVIATWPAPDCLAGVEGLMDALAAGLSPTEVTRRARHLAGAVAVRLVPAASGGVTPIFEVLKTFPALLRGLADASLDPTSACELLRLSFAASRAALAAQGLVADASPDVARS